MANSLSAKKRIKVNQKKYLRNKSMRSQYRTFVAKAEKVITEGDAEAAGEAVKKAISVLDKTAQKRILHPNNVARRKSQLAKKLNAMNSNAE